MMMKKLRLACTVAAALSLCHAAPAQTSTLTNGPYYATPSWDQKLPAATRFVTLANWGGQAVLDRETGLVWKLNLANFADNYAGAVERCLYDTTGDRGGWRLPTIAELMRTVVVGQQVIADSPFPFLNPLAGTLMIWSSTPKLVEQSIGVLRDTGALNTVDLIDTLRLAPSGYFVFAQARLSSNSSAAIWCVQSPAVGS
ncbi:MAG: DUF1566 domain-containing protein [Burkholderiales bacterium]|nr:DUF1566 domain-containing protein [Burkholderiales bacterium]